jgi:hypothetical protein
MPAWCSSRMCFLGRESAPLCARRLQPALRARRRQAQRPGERRLHGAASHLLRNAGQFQLRRLLQARRHPLRLGIPHRHHGPAPEKLWVTVYRTTTRPLPSGPTRSACPRTHHPHRRQGRPEVSLGQLLADGRHRPLRTLHAKSSTTTARTWPAARPAPRGRRRPLHRDLEPGVHAVQPRREPASCTAAASPRWTPAWAWSASPR